MTALLRHCEERSDEAIQNLSAAEELDCFASAHARRRFGGLLPGVARAASADGSLAMTL
jgi:hypothetical protein